MGEHQYHFQYDWFSSHIPIFERRLRHLKGRRCNLLEIGSQEGRSAIWLLENVANHPDARLTCVDIVDHPGFRRNISISGAEPRTIFKRGMSRVVLRELPLDDFDFIYIDGSHWTVDVLEDAVLSFRLAKREGLIAFDDYPWNDSRCNQEGTPKPAIDAFLALYRDKITVLEIGWQVWIRKQRD